MGENTSITAGVPEIPAIFALRMHPSEQIHKLWGTAITTLGGEIGVKNLLLTGIKPQDGAQGHLLGPKYFFG